MARFVSCCALALTFVIQIHLPVSAKQFAPGYTAKFQEWKRANELSIISLYFCPNWYLAARLNQERWLRGRIILQTNSSGEAVVNPKIEEFPSYFENLVELQTISKSVAQRELGGRVNKDLTVTCDLLTDVGNFENNVFHLDFKFDGEKLIEYRIRGCGIPAPKWIVVSGVDLQTSKEVWKDIHQTYDDSGALRYPRERLTQQFKRDMDSRTGDDVCVRSIAKVDWNDRASIFIKSDGTIALSVFQGYGSLEKVTVSNAVHIFGVPIVQEKKGARDFCTYQFGALTGSGELEIEVYHLDCEYDSDGRLMRYKVRATSMPNTDWVRI